MSRMGHLRNRMDCTIRIDRRKAVSGTHRGGAPPVPGRLNHIPQFAARFSYADSPTPGPPRTVLANFRRLTRTIASTRTPALIKVGAEFEASQVPVHAKRFLRAVDDPDLETLRRPRAAGDQTEPPP